MPSINNVSFAGSRKDIDLEIVWFFAYWVIVHENTTAESMVNHSEFFTYIYMNKNKILSGGGKNLIGGGKWGRRGREVGGKGEGTGNGIPPVHPLIKYHIFMFKKAPIIS